MKIQTRILLPIIGLIAILLGVNGYFSYSLVADSMKNDMLSSMQGEADSLQRNIADIVSRSMRDVSRIAKEEHITNFFHEDSADPASIKDIGEFLTSLNDTYIDFARITLVSPQGIVISSSRAEFIGTDLSSHQYFLKALAGKTSFSEPFSSDMSDVHGGIIATATPIILNKNIVAIAVAVISLNRFNDDFVQRAKVGHNGFAFIIRSDGQFVLHKQTSNLFRNDLPAHAMYQEIAQATSNGYNDLINNLKTRVLLYHSKDPFTGLTTCISVDYEEIKAMLDVHRNKILVTMLIGIITSVIILTLLIRPITNALARGVEFAKAIAAGYLDKELDIHRKDELGQLGEALNAIPQTLKSIVKQYNHLEKVVENGNLFAQGDTTHLSNDFANLVSGTNAILTRFRTLIDNLPSPVIILDHDLHATYINKAAENLAGSDYMGHSCKELFQREDYGGSDCALTRAVQTLLPCTGETIAHPRGMALDIAYTAIPLLDRNGKLASVLQLITDLTAIKTTQRTIIDVATQATNISNNVAIASQELSKQIEQVTNGTDIQRDRVSATATAMEEMNSTVLEVARNAAQASEQAESTRVKATEGANLVNNLVTAISQINSVALELDANMKELGKQATSIGSVISVISDIADQTNLLALNAAIEAARAGEAGRGFAVVADEVRKLAESTMSATSEVGSSIQGIQRATTKNIEQVNLATSRIQQATDLANTSGKALQEIQDLATTNSSLIIGIATAAEEQSATSEEINHSVEEINTIAGETAKGMGQSTISIQGVAQLAQELRILLDKLQQTSSTHS